MTFKSLIISSAMMILTMVLLRFISYSEQTINLNKPFSTFPKQIGEWKGKEDFFDKEIIDAIGIDEYLLCNYRKIDKGEVELYIGFYKSQREGDLIHSPKNCMPGSGWSITQSASEEITLSEPNVSKAKINKLNLQKRTEKQIMYYWFQSRGRIVSSEYMEKIFLVVDSITRHRTDGSFIRLMAPVINNDETQTITNLKDFTNQLIPILIEYLPS